MPGTKVHLFPKLRHADILLHGPAQVCHRGWPLLLVVLVLAPVYITTDAMYIPKRSGNGINRQTVNMHYEHATCFRYFGTIVQELASVS